MSRTARDLTKGSIPRHVLALAGPAILSALVHNLYGLNDVYFARFVGKASQTAVSNNLFTLIMIFGFIQLASIGTLTLVARRTGAGNEEGADHAARQGVLFAVAISVVTGALGLLLAPLIPKLMGMAPDVAAESRTYLTIIFIGITGMFLAPTLDSVFRGRGDTMAPLVLHIVAVAANVVGNLLAVKVFNAGTAGIAISTVISRFVWFGVGLWLIRRGRLGIRMKRRAGKLADLPLWKTIARVSAPLGARAFLFGFIYQIVSGITSEYGTEAQNGLGVGIRLEGICFFILVGFGMAAGPIVGQNLGANLPRRALRGAWTTTAISLVPSLLFSFLFFFAPRVFMDAFASDLESAAHGAEYLRIISFSLCFIALEVVLAQSFIGAGDTIPPMLIDVPLTALRVPLALLLAHHFDMGTAGIWWAIGSTAIGRGALMALWFLRKNWMRSRPDLD